MGAARGQALFEQLKNRCQDDVNALKAVEQYEAQFKAALR